MAQNRNKLLELFTGNITNCVVHKVLEKAIDEEIIRRHYDKELNTSLIIARKYRGQINPANRSLPVSETEAIKVTIMKKAIKELKLRIDKGYKNINLNLVEEITDELLKETGVK